MSLTILSRHSHVWLTLILCKLSRLLISFHVVSAHSWIFCHNKASPSLYSLWIHSFPKLLWSLVSTVLKNFLFYSEQLPCFWFRSTRSCLPSNCIKVLLPNPLSVQINYICIHFILFRISQTCRLFCNELNKFFQWGFLYIFFHTRSVSLYFCCIQLFSHMIPELWLSLFEMSEKPNAKDMAFVIIFFFLL